MSDITFIYVTASSREEAEKLAEAVVADRLAACANILPGMKSVYHWQGRIERAEEAVVIFKTRKSLFSAVGEKVRELHSYETPCIVSLPVGEGNAGYLEWIMAETKP